jgi:xanthine/CO dehydrogenase XdhC/CoxF family maturation factor
MSSASASPRRRIEVFVERLGDAQRVCVRCATTSLWCARSSSPQRLGVSRPVLRSDRWRDAARCDIADEALKTATIKLANALLAGGESRAAPLATSAGDEARVYFDVSLPQPTLIIVGAGHISIPLSQLARVLGYHVTVIDARETFATPERLPEANEILVEWPDEALARIP